MINRVHSPARTYNEVKLQLFDIDIKVFDYVHVSFQISILGMVVMGMEKSYMEQTIVGRQYPVSILRKSISGRHRPVRVADGPMTPDIDLRRMLAE